MIIYNTTLTNFNCVLIYYFINIYIFIVKMCFYYNLKCRIFVVARVKRFV